MNNSGNEHRADAAGATAGGRKIGGHVSAAGGPHKAVERAAAIGANCVQIFSGSPRSWKRKPIEELDAEAVSQACAEYGVSPLITHSLYLINLVSEDPALVEKSMDALRYDMRFDALLGGSGIVVHLGSHQGRGWEAVRGVLRDRIAAILAEAPAGAHFLIENSAGQNGKLSSDFLEIRTLLDELSSPALGWCFDTCHAHAAGFHLGDPSGQGKTAVGSKDARDAGSAIAEIERLKLWDELVCIHVNDSRDERGSGRDRHADIGDGLIDADDLSFFLNYTPLIDLPIILEVPGVDAKGPDKENIDRVLRIVGEG
jgi:deoxyribonuclease IV